MEKREPLLDIIVLVHSQHVWADLAIRAVEGHTKNPYRLILVDMASTRDCKTILADAEDRGHTIVRLAENRSFSNGVNTGVRAGSAKFIAILNDDAIVTEGWDGALLQDASEKQVGLVGARSNAASGAQGNPGFIGEPPYLVFVCVALRRQVWDAVGPLDEETFDGFSTEDVDYSWRVRKAGYKLKVSNAFVLHAGSRSLSVAVGDEAARAQNNVKYGARLIEKWGWPHVKANSELQQKGLVVTYHSEHWTRVEFMRNVLGLRKSDEVGFSYLDVRRAPIQMARQLACDYALDNGFDWMVQLDDDATFPADLLRRLLSHGKDVVCALAYQRKIPHGVCAFELTDEGILGRPMEGIEHTGLRKVDVSGFHCSILRTSVIRKLREGRKDADGKVIVPGTRQYFGGFENKLGEDFAFPVAPETPVLGADWRWRPITEYQPGDSIIGFDEQSPKHSSRRFGVAIVEKLVRKTLPRIRIVTDEREIMTTSEHPWLSVGSAALVGSRRWAWTPAGALKTGNAIASVTPVVRNPNLRDLDYAAGYVQGLLRTDGTRYASLNRKVNRIYSGFVVKMKDTAPLERLATMLALLGIESTRGAALWDGDYRHAPMHKLGVQTQAAVRKLDPIFSTSYLSESFAAGFLAGAYDGDGSHHGGGLFIASCEDAEKDRYEAAAKLCGVSFTARDARHVRICGQDRIFRFWQRTSPSLSRRMSLLGQLGNDGVRRGKEVKHRPEIVRAIEALPPEEVFCLTTSTGTFVADGLASHNCLNIKKLGIPIYCDTELISGHIGAETIVDEAYKKAYVAGQIAPVAQLK